MPDLAKIQEELWQLEDALNKSRVQLGLLKAAVGRLEEEKQGLQRAVAGADVSRPAWELLRNLYREGFHVCPSAFACRRASRSDCLFCLSFLAGGEVTGD